MKTADKNEKKVILDGLIDLFRQHRRWLLFFGTGTSCALDSRFGMPALAKHLEKELVAMPDWRPVADRLATGLSLEQALSGIGLPQTIKTKIQRITGDFVSSADRSNRNDVLLGKKQWVGEYLLKELVQRLPPSNPRLSVVTANYDMLIEYACASQGIRFTTGFLGDLIRSWDWEGSQDSLNRCLGGRDGARNKVRISPLPRVELFKVHGSINRFSKADGQMECNLWVDDVPTGYERVIAAPGDQKYETYADLIDTAAQGRQAQVKAMGFMVVGYGFNDPHLDERIRTRIKQQDCPLIVATLDLAEAQIAKLQELGTRIWILVAPKIRNAGNDESRTLVYMPGEMDPYILDGERLWSCDSFAEKVIGG